MINIRTLEKIGINYTKGLMYFGKDDVLYQKYLLDFAQEEYSKTALEKLNEGDVKGAFNAVHSLKSLVEYVSIPCIDNIVHEITETLRDGRTEGVQVGLIFIQNATEEIKATILKQCKEQ